MESFLNFSLEHFYNHIRICSNFLQNDFIKNITKVSSYLREHWLKGASPSSTLTSTFRSIALLTHFLRQRFFFWICILHTSEWMYSTVQRKTGIIILEYFGENFIERKSLRKFWIKFCVYSVEILKFWGNFVETVAIWCQ